MSSSFRKDVLTFTDEQAAKCTFPPSCPVLYFNKTRKDVIQGLVASVLIDMGRSASRDKLFCIIPVNPALGELRLPEREIQFAPNCPVWHGEISAEVMTSYHMFNRSDEVRYSIQLHDGMIRHGVQKQTLRYRPTDETRNMLKRLQERARNRPRQNQPRPRDRNDTSQLPPQTRPALVAPDRGNSDEEKSKRNGRRSRDSGSREDNESITARERDGQIRKQQRRDTKAPRSPSPPPPPPPVAATAVSMTAPLNDSSVSKKSNKKRQKCEGTQNPDPKRRQIEGGIGSRKSEPQNIIYIDIEDPRDSLPSEPIQQAPTDNTQSMNASLAKDRRTEPSPTKNRQVRAPETVPSLSQSVQDQQHRLGNTNRTSNSHPIYPHVQTARDQPHRPWNRTPITNAQPNHPRSHPTQSHQLDSRTPTSHTQSQHARFQPAQDQPSRMDTKGRPPSASQHNYSQSHRAHRERTPISATDSRFQPIGSGPGRPVMKGTQSASQFPPQPARDQPQRSRSNNSQISSRTPSGPVGQKNSVGVFGGIFGGVIEGVLGRVFTGRPPLESTEPKLYGNEEFPQNRSSEEKAKKQEINKMTKPTFRLKQEVHDREFVTLKVTKQSEPSVPKRFEQTDTAISAKSQSAPNQQKRDSLASSISQGKPRAATNTCPEVKENLEGTVLGRRGSVAQQETKSQVRPSPRRTPSLLSNQPTKKNAEYRYKACVTIPPWIAELPRIKVHVTNKVAQQVRQQTESQIRLVDLRDKGMKVQISSFAPRHLAKAQRQIEDALVNEVTKSERGPLLFHFTEGRSIITDPTKPRRQRSPENLETCSYMSVVEIPPVIYPRVVADHKKSNLAKWCRQFHCSAHLLNRKGDHCPVLYVEGDESVNVERFLESAEGYIDDVLKGLSDTSSTEVDTPKSPPGGNSTVSEAKGTEQDHTAAGEIPCSPPTGPRPNSDLGTKEVTASHRKGKSLLLPRDWLEDYSLALGALQSCEDQISETTRTQVAVYTDDKGIRIQVVGGGERTKRRAILRVQSLLLDKVRPALHNRIQYQLALGEDPPENAESRNIVPLLDTNEYGLVLPLSDIAKEHYANGANDPFIDCVQNITGCAIRANGVDRVQLKQPYLFLVSEDENAVEDALQLVMEQIAAFGRFHPS